MNYKTIVLELLQHHPEKYNQLRSKRMLLPTLQLHARNLKTRHDAWKHCLSQAKPGSDACQIASEALEMALKELEDYLTSASPSEENEPPSLEAAMAFIRGHTPPA